MIVGVSDTQGWIIINRGQSTFARASHASVVFDRYLISFGGFSSSGSINTIDAFDMDNDKLYDLNPQGQLLTPRNSLTACLYNKNKVLVYGGISGYDPSYYGYYGESNFQKYNTATQFIIRNDQTISLAVEKTSNTGPYRYKHTSCVYKKLMCVFGGLDNHQQASNQLWYLSLGDHVWKEAQTEGKIPSQRYGHCCAISEDKMFIFGGRSSFNQILNDFWIFDFKNSKWVEVSLTGKVPSLGEGASMSLFDNKLFCFGGILDNGGFNKNFSVYEIDTGDWTLLSDTKNKPTDRCYHTSAFYNNKFVIFGGGLEHTNHANYPNIFNQNSPIKACPNMYYLAIEQFDPNQPVKAGIGSYIDQVKELFLDKSYSDVTFIIGKQEIPAHRCLLATRCKYFKNMFESGMKESTADKVKVPDVKPETFKAIIEYIYCNEVKLEEDLALDVLGFCEKYAVLELKKMCEEFLSKLLSLKNFASFADAAHKFEATHLEKAVVKFVTQNLDKMEKIDSFYDMPKPILAKVILLLHKK